MHSLVFSDSPTVFVKLHYYRKVSPNVFSQEFFYNLLDDISVSRIYLVKQIGDCDHRVFYSGSGNNTLLTM